MRAAARHPHRRDGRRAGGGAGRDRGDWPEAAHPDPEQEAPKPAPAAAQELPARAPAIGDRVKVGALGLEGVVQALHDREAEIDVRGKRLRARVDELRVLVPASVGPAQPAKVRVNVELQPREGSVTELNVIGCSVDEALARAEKFLDEALMAEVPGSG